MIDQRAWLLRTDPMHIEDPSEPNDANDPTLPIEANEPMLAIDRTEPVDPMDSTESLDHSDHLELFPMSSIVALHRRPAVARSAQGTPAGDGASQTGPANARDECDETGVHVR